MTPETQDALRVFVSTVVSCVNCPSCRDLAKTAMMLFDEEEEEHEVKS